MFLLFCLCTMRKGNARKSHIHVVILRPLEKEMLLLSGFFLEEESTSATTGAEKAFEIHRMGKAAPKINVNVVLCCVVVCCAGSIPRLVCHRLPLTFGPPSIPPCR